MILNSYAPTDTRKLIRLILIVQNNWLYACKLELTSKYLLPSYSVSASWLHIITWSKLLLTVLKYIFSRLESKLTARRDSSLILL